MVGVEMISSDPPATLPLDLSEFCRLEHPRLVGMLSLYCGDVDLAEELAQEAIVRVCQHWRRVSTMAAPGAWAHRVAVNLANSSFRRWSAGRRALNRLDRNEGIQTGEDGTNAVILRRVIATLPVRQRTALVLRYYADLSIQQVAVAMSCSEGTVKALTHQAIASLRSTSLMQLSEVIDGD